MTNDERILKGVARGDKRILIGPDARQIEVMARLLPVSYWGLLKRASARRIAAASARS